MKVLFTITLAVAALGLAYCPVTAAGTQRRRLKGEHEPKPTKPPTTTTTGPADNKPTKAPKALPACGDAHYADGAKCWNLKDKKDGALVDGDTCYEKRTKWIAYAGGGCYGKKEECDCNT